MTTDTAPDALIAKLEIARVSGAALKARRSAC